MTKEIVIKIIVNVKIIKMEKLIEWFNGLNLNQKISLITGIVVILIIIFSL